MLFEDWALGRGGLGKRVPHREADALSGKYPEPPRLAAGRFVSVNGVGLHYIERGRGAPVVYLHGAGLLAEELFCSPVGDALAERYRVIAFDRPGYGHSGRDPSLSGPAAQARLFHSALARLGVQRPILVGHSWSGALVLHYGAAFPEDVAGIVSLAGWSFATHRTSLKLISAISQGSMETILGTPFGPKLARRLAWDGLRHVFAPAPIPAGFESLPVELMIRASQLRATAGDIKALNADILKIQRQYHRFRVPREVIVSAADRVVDSDRHGRRLARVVPDARLTEADGAGHMIHHVRPDLLMAAVARLDHFR